MFFSKMVSNANIQGFVLPAYIPAVGFRFKQKCITGHTLQIVMCGACKCYSTLYQGMYGRTCTFCGATITHIEEI